jgi:hypothetical protein
MFKVVVAGGRNFTNYELLEKTLDGLLINKLKNDEVVIISGGALGADSLGQRYAKERGLECVVYPADWSRYGKSAGSRRNAEMCAVCDAVCAFWNGTSPGTKSMIDMAKKSGKLIFVEWYL